MSKNELKTKEISDIDRIARYFNWLADNIKTGKLYIHNNKRMMSLSPQKDISLKVEASQKDDKEKFYVKLSWDRVVAE